MQWNCFFVSFVLFFFFFVFSEKIKFKKSVYMATFWPKKNPKMCIYGSILTPKKNPNVYMAAFWPKKPTKIDIYGSLLTPKKKPKCVYMAPFWPPKKNPNSFSPAVGCVKNPGFSQKIFACGGLKIIQSKLSKPPTVFCYFYMSW